MAVHERPVGASVEWYTPPSLFGALGLEFDLDPASPCPPVPWVPARQHYCIDGEKLPWDDRVWLNPPYGPTGVPFIERMIVHNHGLLLVPARTETRIFQKALHHAAYIVFLRDRLHFVRPDGRQSRASFASVLMAFGNDIEMIQAVHAADLGWSVAPNLHPRFASLVGACPRCGGPGHSLLDCLNAATGWNLTHVGGAA